MSGGVDREIGELVAGVRHLASSVDGLKESSLRNHAAFHSRLDDLQRLWAATPSRDEHDRLSARLNDLTGRVIIGEATLQQVARLLWWTMGLMAATASALVAAIVGSFFT